MELDEFIIQTQNEVESEKNLRLNESDGVYPYEESVFTELVMQHMAEVGITNEPVICHYSSKVGNANLKLSGYAISEDCEQIDLFVSLYDNVRVITPIPDSDTKAAAEQCLRFLSNCVSGKIFNSLECHNDAFMLARTIHEQYINFDQIRIYVLTDKKAKSKSFQPRLIEGKTIKLEVMDIERLFRHWLAGKPRDELVVDFGQIVGSPLPCVYVPNELSNYDYALTVFPGQALFHLYEKFGARLLEANVRSFLSTSGKVNKGIRDTLRHVPEQFMAYNNGIVIVADEASLGRTEDGFPGIQWLKGMQIVNGGQTTASIYFTRKKFPETVLDKVRVPAKVIILKTVSNSEEEDLISNISRFSNSQNVVRQADLSANKPFHVEMEKLSMNTYCPDGTGRWFYERASGSYNVILAREGNTPAKLKQIKNSIPSSRKITKTDLAKYMNAWDMKPFAVSLGAQKCFADFMKKFESETGEEIKELPDLDDYKRMIAKTIFFKTVQKLVRPQFPAFQANITAYTVSVAAWLIGQKLDLSKIWYQQDLSEQLKQYLISIAKRVGEILHQTSRGRMVSEWAKKPECWDAVIENDFAVPDSNIPELTEQTGSKK